MSEYFSKVKYC